MLTACLKIIAVSSYNSITADINKRKVYPLTGNVHFDNTDDNYRFEVDFSDCTLKSYKNDELIRVRHDYSTVYDLAKFISSITQEKIIERYLKFDKKHPHKFYPDRFFITDENWCRIEQIYFNPDADSGSQYVVNVFYGADIIEALEETTSVFDFFANLEESCHQYLYDIGDEDYEEVRNKYENEQPSFEGKSFNSMLILCRLALTEEFIKNNLKESEYFGVGIYTLYKIAERFLVGYNNWEFDDNPVEEYPIKPKEKICVASTTVDILDNEYLAEGFIDFDKQEKTLEVAGVVVRREGYVKLSELVEDLQTLEFAEFMSLTESEEKLFLESKTPGRVGYYDYEELRKAAGSGKSEDINRLGEWFSLFGARYWNGEYYDADGLEIYPVYQEIDETGDSFEVVGYSTSKPEVIKYVSPIPKLDKCSFSGLDLLALLENMRISQKYDKDNTDFIIRLCESFLAEFMQYKDRHEWTSKLCEMGLVHYGVVPNLKEAEEKYLELLSKLGGKTE